MLNLQCAESTVFDYKEFYHGSIKPYLACDSTDLAAINNSRTALLQALKKLDQSSKKKVISFMFTHPLFATRSKEDIVHVKKRDLLYYLSSNEIINSEEYLDYAAMLCYFPLLLYAHKIGHETRQLLADWGVNPLWGYDVKATKINKMHQHMSKSPIMAYYEPKIRTYLLKSLCAKDDMYYNTLFDELSPELIEKSAHHAHECALQRINFYKEQIKLNAIFNKKSVPSLAALIGIQLLNKVFFCDEKKQQKKDPQELVRFLKQQDTGHQNLFTALLFFSPESPLNQQFSISKKIDVLNVVSPILPTHRYVYYRTILEYFSSILNVSNLSFSVVHKVLDLGGDPRAVLNNCNAKKKAAIKTLEGCDHRWASLAIFNIISLEKKCFKACEEKLAHYLMHLQKELLVDFMAYFLHAMKEKNYYALKFLLRVVRPGLQNVQAIKEHGRGDKNIRKIINNYRFD
jgi:hypothetical protein